MSIKANHYIHGIISWCLLTGCLSVSAEQSEMQRLYDFDEKAAAIAGRGLHASKVQAPSAHRKARIKVQAPPADGCVVKGNISSRGAHIFHTPGQRDYTLTKINTAQGERWFCSAQDARQAGWRAARR